MGKAKNIGQIKDAGWEFGVKKTVIAPQELFNRQLSDQEIQAAKQEILAKRIQKEEEQENIKVVQRRVKASGA
ncbi:MAG: hypothetical protein M9904_18125 [Chitinophagaceae bacterium]|nr:hypothetical protein [Chitinophagaceae bacterium]